MRDGYGTMRDGYGTIGQLSLDYPVAANQVIDNVYLVRSPLWGPTALLSPAAIYIGTVVIISGGDVLVVDPGLAYHPATYLVPFLKSLGLDAKNIRLIVNSHDHFDHVLGNPSLREMSGAPVAAHPAASVPGGVDTALQDGQTVRCGDAELQVLHTPGHSPTALSLWWEDRQLLICGDTIQGNGDYSQGLPILTDIPAYRSSLARLRSLNAKHLITAHLYRYQSSPVLRGEEITAHIDESARWCQLYEEDIQQVLHGAKTPISRADLHAHLVEFHAWHPEEAKLFTAYFLSAWSRPTVEAFLSQCTPQTALVNLADEAWPDVGELAESEVCQQP